MGDDRPLIGRLAFHQLPDVGLTQSRLGGRHGPARPAPVGIDNVDYGVLGLTIACAVQVLLTLPGNRKTTAGC